MHKQYQEWYKTHPLRGLKVLHHVPLVTNTLLKIACLVAAGAEVTVTNPHFLTPHPAAIAALKKAKISYVENLNSLPRHHFDLYFDCGAEIYQNLGAPKIGAIELTASGDQFYRNQDITFPVVSIDPTATKQLETLFGSAESFELALSQLTGLNLVKKSWLIFGFGKIGRGLAYCCKKNHTPVTIVEIDRKARMAAEQLGLITLDPMNVELIEKSLLRADVVITATGKKNIFNSYPKTWFKNKILANMGVLDEFGNQFTTEEVLNNKLPINFILSDPTSINI